MVLTCVSANFEEDILKRAIFYNLIYTKNREHPLSTEYELQRLGSETNDKFDFQISCHESPIYKLSALYWQTSEALR